MTPAGVKILTVLIQSITGGLFGVIRDAVRKRKARRAAKKNRKWKSNLGTSYGRSKRG